MIRIAAEIAILIFVCFIGKIFYNFIANNLDRRQKRLEKKRLEDLIKEADEAMSFKEKIDGT